jgi:hypothetical protein
MIGDSSQVTGEFADHDLCSVKPEEGIRPSAKRPDRIGADGRARRIGEELMRLFGPPSRFTTKEYHKILCLSMYIVDIIRMEW